MKYTVNPAKPAVMREVEPAKGATVTLEVSLKQLAQLRALVGQVMPPQIDDLFQGLDDAVEDSGAERVFVGNEDDIKPIVFVSERDGGL